MGPEHSGIGSISGCRETLAENIQWTSDLGNAFLAQQADVMAAVQRMRAKAQGTGNFKTSAQQKVETQTIEGGQQAIVIQPADPRRFMCRRMTPRPFTVLLPIRIRRSLIRDMSPVRRWLSERE